MRNSQFVYYIAALSRAISALLVSLCQGEKERIKNLGSQEQKSELRVVEEERARVSE